MRAQVSWLTAAERSCVVDEALGILARTGVRLGACHTLAELATTDASVDRESGVVRLPRALVESSVARLPRTVLLAGASPADDCLLDGALHFVPSGTPSVTLDFETGEYRPSTLEDVRRAVIVADAMPAVDVLWPLVGATDVPADRAQFASIITNLAWSNKHLQDDVTQPWQVAPVLALLETLCGSLAEFRARPRLSFCCCTTSPLAVDGDCLDATIGVARHGAPILIYPMPIAGATAPVTVAGSVTMNVAEFLGVATIIAQIAPGAPLIMGAGTSVLDMKATTFSFGAPEAALMCAACIEIAHDLGVPVLAPGLASDAKYAGIQAGYEKALKGLVVAAAGADLVTGGIGQLSGAGIMSLPQIVIDAEIATMIRRLLGETEVSAKTVMSEAIARIGFKADYLKEKETVRRLRAGEQFMPAIATRLSLEAWQAGGKDELGVASEQVREIIRAADQRGPAIAPDALAELERIADEAALACRSRRGV